MGRLDSKVAVIAGATGGIGWRAAGIFVAKGASVVMAGRRAPEGEALAKEPGAARGPQMDHEATRLCHLAQGVRSGVRGDCSNAGRAMISDAG
jgi:NAD(P)-dependent dehydrogenase (short-subunit alcohol dehydrogenase family)